MWMYEHAYTRGTSADRESPTLVISPRARVFLPLSVATAARAVPTISVIVVGCCVGLVAALEPPFILQAALCLGVVVAVLFTLSQGNTRIGVWQPAAGLLIGLLGYMLLAPWANEGHPIEWAALAVVGAFLAALSVGVCLGYVAAGLFHLSRAEDMEDETDVEVSGSFIRFFACLGIVVGILAVIQGLVTGAGYSLVDASSSAGTYSYLVAAFQICLVIVVTGSRTFNRLVVVVLLIASTIVLASGFRGGLLTLGAFVFVWLRFEGGWLRSVLKRLVPMLAAIGIVLLFYGAVGQARANIGYTQDRIDVLKFFTSVGLPDAETMRAALSRADSGQFLLAGLAGYSPTLRGQNILTYLTAPVTTAFVPPQLFAKPSYDFGRALSYEVYGIPYGTPTSSTVTWFGEAWLVAGWQGVVLIPLPLGLLIGAGVRLVRQLRPALWAPTMGILTVASLDIEHSLITLTGGLLRQMAYLLLVALLYQAGSSLLRKRSKPLVVSP